MCFKRKRFPVGSRIDDDDNSWLGDSKYTRLRTISGLVKRTNWKICFWKTLQSNIVGVVKLKFVIKQIDKIQIFHREDNEAGISSIGYLPELIMKQ